MTTIYCCECQVVIRTLLYGKDIPEEKRIGDVCGDCREELRLQLDALRTTMHIEGRKFPPEGDILRGRLWLMKTEGVG